MFKNITFKKIVILALLVRLILLPLGHHSDAENHVIWGIYAKEFGFKGFYDWLNFGNYARSNYPPLSIVLFKLLRDLWQVIFNILWKINISIQIFPSNIVTWFDAVGFQKLTKLPAILGDLAIGTIIYKYLFPKDKKKALVASAFYLLSPAVIYLSSLWGQLDPFVAALGLLALVLTMKKRYYFAFTLYFLSIMTKQTMLPLAPVLLLVALKNKIDTKTLSVLGVLGVIYLAILGSLFAPGNPVFWLVDRYLTAYIKGAPLAFINLNAFNFWGLTLGLERLSDTSLILGLSINTWLWILTGFLISMVFLKMKRGANVFFATAVLYFTIFMFAPRIHERFFYPVLVFLPFVFWKARSIKKIFIILSVIGLINLYHWWWFPEINLFITFFDLEVVERLLSLVNLVLFIIIFKAYLTSINENRFINNNR